VSVADSVGIVVGGLCTAETAVLTAVMAFLNFPAEARSLLGRSEMNARHVIDSASFGPEALKAIGEAFDGAWREIAGNFGDDPRDIELARLRLANAMLSVACEESRDVEALKNGALQAMALGYRERASAERLEISHRH
jgi:hypothetical protein